MLPLFRIIAALAVFVVHHARGSPPLPSLSVPRCNESAPALLEGLTFSNGSAPFPAGTTISLCWTPSSLVLEFRCRDARILRNDYLQCNSPMYTQEVVEVFIAPRGLEAPANYLEVETTPLSALYASFISNPYLNGSISHALVDCDASGIDHFSSSDEGAQAWSAVLAVPWALVNAAAPSAAAAAAQSGDVYRANFYRINMRHNVSACSADDCDYGAWSATLLSPPSFHQPRRFGVLALA